MKKGFKYLSLGLTCIRILQGDVTAVADLPQKVLGIYADADWDEIVEFSPF